MSDNCVSLTREMLDQWATASDGPVALHLKQRLVAVECCDEGDQIIYPPTYADIGYNIDRLSDGTRVALIDSVGSQANRIEPAFKPESRLGLHKLVPQIDIVLKKEPCGECGECQKKNAKAEKCENPIKHKRSLLDFAHRIADSVIRSSPTLQPSVEAAFRELYRTGNAAPLCAIAPTSLIFGCWDSRGGTGEKRPRLVRAIIRAWDVDELHTAAQFNSIWKALSEDQQDDFTKEATKHNKKKPNEALSKAGFKDAPAIHYKGTTRRILGGILVRGSVIRDVTINLVALRGLSGAEHTDALRKYLLALSILSGTVDIDLFLREGSNLKYADNVDHWYSVARRGANVKVDLTSENAKSLLLEYAMSAAKPFLEAWNQLGLSGEHEFSLTRAKELLGTLKETEEEEKDE